MRSRVCMRHVADDVSGNTSLALHVLERVGLDAAPVFVKTGCRVFNELSVLKTCRNDLARNGVRQRDIGPNVEAGPRMMQLFRTALDALEVIPKRACNRLFDGAGFWCHTGFRGTFAHKSPSFHSGS